MRDIELYRALLALTAPWTVASMGVDLPRQRVVVRVDVGAGPHPCPECGQPAPRYDGNPRRWRHLDTRQFTTWIEADVPRLDCGTHGVKQVRVPWAEPGSQFTGSATPSTSTRPSSFTAAASISTHTKPGRTEQRCAAWPSLVAATRP